MQNQNNTFFSLNWLSVDVKRDGGGSDLDVTIVSRSLSSLNFWRDLRNDVGMRRETSRSYRRGAGCICNMSIFWSFDGNKSVQNKWNERKHVQCGEEIKCAGNRMRFGWDKFLFFNNKLTPSKQEKKHKWNTQTIKKIIKENKKMYAIWTPTY